MTEPIQWLSTKEASERLGITLRSLYRFIDEGDLVAYKFGRVIRLQESDIARFIERCRVSPGSLEHLYPELKGSPRPKDTPGSCTAGGAPSEPTG
ncbi:MAG: helix-turn-helix domain-containing protein [Acidimicrobiales bacterium]